MTETQPSPMAAYAPPCPLTATGKAGITAPSVVAPAPIVPAVAAAGVTTGEKRSDGGIVPTDIAWVRVERPWLEDLRDWLLQSVAVTAAIVFGTWTVLAWQVAQQANVQSSQANALAFAVACAQLTPGAASVNVSERVLSLPLHETK